MDGFRLYFFFFFQGLGFVPKGSTGRLQGPPVRKKKCAEVSSEDAEHIRTHRQSLHAE